MCFIQNGNSQIREITSLQSQYHTQPTALHRAVRFTQPFTYWPWFSKERLPLLNHQLNSCFGHKETDFTHFKIRKQTGSLDIVSRDFAALTAAHQCPSAGRQSPPSAQDQTCTRWMVMRFLSTQETDFEYFPCHHVPLSVQTDPCGKWYRILQNRVGQDATQ